MIASCYLSHLKIELELSPFTSEGPNKCFLSMKMMILLMMMMMTKHQA